MHYQKGMRHKRDNVYWVIMPVPEHSGYYYLPLVSWLSVCNNQLVFSSLSLSLTFMFTLPACPKTQNKQKHLHQMFKIFLLMKERNDAAWEEL